jgi:hypothetical protein
MSGEGGECVSCTCSCVWGRKRRKEGEATGAGVGRACWLVVAASPSSLLKEGDVQLRERRRRSVKKCWEQKWPEQGRGAARAGPPAFARADHKASLWGSCGCLMSEASRRRLPRKQIGFAAAFTNETRKQKGEHLSRAGMGPQHRRRKPLTLWKDLLLLTGLQPLVGFCLLSIPSTVAGLRWREGGEGTVAWEAGGAAGGGPGGGAWGRVVGRVPCVFG